MEESDGQRGKPSSNAVAIQKSQKIRSSYHILGCYCVFYDALKFGKISFSKESQQQFSKLKFLILKKNHVGFMILSR